MHIGDSDVVFYMVSQAAIVNSISLSLSVVKCNHKIDIVFENITSF